MSGKCRPSLRKKTLLIDKEEYIGYCKMACLPLSHSEKGGEQE